MTFPQRLHIFLVLGLLLAACSDAPTPPNGNLGADTGESDVTEDGLTNDSQTTDVSVDESDGSIDDSSTQDVTNQDLTTPDVSSEDSTSLEDAGFEDTTISPSDLSSDSGTEGDGDVRTESDLTDISEHTPDVIAGDVVAGDVVNRDISNDDARVADMGSDAISDLSIDLGDVDGPVIAIQTPDADSTFGPGMISFSGTASDASSFQLRVRIDEDSWAPIEGTTSWTVELDASALGDGVHQFAIQGADEFANSTVETLDFYIDATPPTATINGAPEGPTSDTSFELTIGGEDVVSYRYALDEGEYSEATEVETGISFSGLTEGEHTVSVYGSDQYGNEQVVASTVTFVIDITPPVAVFDADTLPPMYTTTTSINITVEGEGVAQYRYQLNEGGFGTARNQSQPIALNGLPEQGYLLEVVGIDAAGNQQFEPTEYVWYVDLSAPTIALNQTPDEITNQTETSIDVGGSVDLETFSWRLDDGEYSEPQGINQDVELADLSEGEHTFEAIGWDRAGNQSSNVASFTWLIDITPPVVELSNLPTNPTSQTSINVTVGGDDVERYMYAVDSLEFLGPYAVSETIQVSGLSEGSHTLNVFGIDAAGNTQSIITNFEWTIDLSEPTAVIAPGQGNPTNLTGATFNISGEGVVFYRYYYDDDTFGEPIDVGQEIVIGSLSEGSHTLYVLGINSLGVTQSTPSQYTWVVDTTPPSAELTNLPAALTNNPHINITVGGNQVVLYRRSLDEGPLSDTTPISTHITATDLPDGEHTVSVLGRDAAGNEQASPTVWTWTIDTVPPQAGITGAPSDPSNNSQPTFGVAGADVVAYRWRLDSAPTYSSFNPVSSQTTLPPLSDGQHTLYVVGVDAAGNQQVTPTTHVWTVDTLAPTATLSGTPSSPTSQTSISVTVGGVGVTAYRYSLDSGTVSAERNPSIPITASGLSDGQHTLDVWGRDAAGNWQNTMTPFVWTVDTQ
ncbi:MAG: hypothetical protein KC561_05270, partial [Myxococcales bacterium]|nr:hypothetical protein [Myxococcales bacterium]